MKKGRRDKTEGNKGMDKNEGCKEDGEVEKGLKRKGRKEAGKSD